MRLRVRLRAGRAPGRGLASHNSAVRRGPVMGMVEAWHMGTWTQGMRCTRIGCTSVRARAAKGRQQRTGIEAVPPHSTTRESRPSLSSPG